MSTSRDLHNIFFASVFIFHLCGNFSVRNGFYNIFFLLDFFLPEDFKTKNPERCFLLVVINVTGSVSTL